MEVTMRYHDSDEFRIGTTIVDARIFRCPSCPFMGGEDAMVDHAQAVGHIALPERRLSQRHDEEDELTRMMDEGCPNG